MNNYKNQNNMLIPFSELKEKYNISPRGILHVGASTGQEAKAYADGGVKNVIWVEAIPSVYEKLQKNIKQFPGSIALNACITEEDDKEIEFNVSSNDGESSSIYEFGTHADVHPDVTFVDRMKLKTKRLDTLLQEEVFFNDEFTDRFDKKITDFDFLNIDLQGAELGALKSLGDLLKYFEYVYIEVNAKELYKGCALFPEVEKYLNSFGFVCEDVKWAGDTGWGDAIFIKRPKFDHAQQKYLQGILDAFNMLHWKVTSNVDVLTGYACDILSAQKIPATIFFNKEKQEYILIEL